MSSKQATYPVKNMTCAACATSVENMLKFTDGVEDASVNYASALVKVTYNDALVDFYKMQSQVQAIGYDLAEVFDPIKQRKENLKEYNRTRLKLLISVAFSLPVFLIAMVFTNVNYSGLWQFALSLPVILYSGRDYYISAFKKLRHKNFNMDTLIALGTGSAFLYSVINTFFPQWFIQQGLEPHIYYESAVVIITLILLGKTIEERAKAGTGKAIENLLDLQPKTAHLITDNEETTIAIDQLKEGDLLQIYPGEQIPVDGIVTQGESYVDESMINGEPLPTTKKADDKVIAGTMNQSGSLIVRTERTGYATLLSQIIQQVQDAQGSKAPAQKLADKISSIFVPTVITIALLSFVVWWIFGPSFTHAFSVLISVLIIACPCALGLATPTAITVGIGKGARQGILIKDAQAFQTLNNVNVLALDKTGTITKGKPSVARIVYAPSVDQKKVDVIIKSIESRSEHPIARALSAYFDCDKAEVTNFTSVTGNGLQASMDHTNYFIGKQGWPISTTDHWYLEAIEAFKVDASTIVQISTATDCLAIIAVQDEIKDHVKEQIELLHQDSIGTIMLTGDNETSAQSIANKVGINEIYTSLLPADKAEKVKNYQDEGEVIAMAGDGINDSPALAQADIGIAMSTGADIAIESAQVTLLNGDISKIRKAIKLAHDTTTTIRQNLFWAFIYNIIAIPIAAGILYPFNGFLLNPMIAGGAMAFSSVTVVFNSLWLRRK